MKEGAYMAEEKVTFIAQIKAIEGVEDQVRKGLISRVALIDSSFINIVIREEHKEAVHPAQRCPPK
jgi:hypothetical protein